MITLHEPYDVQVAAAWPAVNAYRDGFVAVACQRAVVRRATRYRDWALANYITTTEAGREGRARAVERLEEAEQELAALVARLPLLAEAARAEAPAAAERVRLSVSAYAATLAGEHELYGDDLPWRYRSR